MHRVRGVLGVREDGWRRWLEKMVREEGGETRRWRREGIGLFLMFLFVTSTVLYAFIFPDERISTRRWSLGEPLRRHAGLEKSVQGCSVKEQVCR